MSPRKLRAYDKAFILAEKRKDKEMLIQATYYYEALGTVMANAFGKSKVKWRTKTFSEEWEEQKMCEDEDLRIQKRREYALEMNTMRSNFIIAKQRGELEQI